MRGLLAPLIKLIAFLLVTSAATYVLAATIANTSYGDTNSFKADFTDASGLNVGDDVRVAGVRVGTVDDIKVVEEKDSGKRVAQVSFTVEKSRPLPESVDITLRYRNLVGQRYLDITQGAGGTGTLDPGATVPSSQTHPAVDLTVLFQGFKPLFQGLDADQINSLATEIIQTLQGEGGSLELLLSTLADLSNSVADRDAVIGDVVTNLTNVLTTLGNRDTELSNLVVQLQGFVSGLAQDRTTIGNAIDGINDLATSTAGLLTKVRAPLARDIQDVTGLVGVLNQNQAPITYVLKQLPGTVGALIRTASYGSWFNFYLCSVSGTIQLPGGKFLDIPAARVVAEVEVPVMADPTPHPTPQPSAQPTPQPSAASTEDAKPKMQTRRVSVGGKPFSSRNPTTIGAIGLVLILTILWAAFNAESLPLIGGGTSYTAYFSESANLREGDEVRIAGVKVGKVDSVTLDTGDTTDQVKVVFKVKNAFIGDESTASIRIKTLLGAKYLAIDSVGTKAQDADDPITRDRTTSPFDIYPAFTELTTTIQDIDTDNLAKALQTLSSAFQDTPKSVQSVLTGITRLSTTISSRDAELRTLLARANQVTGVLADRDAELQKLFTDGGLLLDELNARRDQIHSLLINTTTLSLQLEGLVDDNQKTIGPLLDQVDKILTLLRDNQDSLDQGLALLGPFYRVFNNTIGNGRWFDNYICNISPSGVLGILGLQNDTGKCS